ncbi:hypothetical protein HD806DRAFT_540028 [Xylariaceae sp. AK1471]|nr:hypothetical protein HD806DRAFT_540028 [Xylariaceae sp. AK1471]
MKFTTAVASLLHAVTILAAPTILPQESAPASHGASPAVNDSQPGDADNDATAASWRLDCGSPGTTNMCSASNSGAHCDPITGTLTIILEGTCGACKCISSDQCTGRCG